MIHQSLHFYLELLAVKLPDFSFSRHVGDSLLCPLSYYLEINLVLEWIVIISVICLLFMFILLYSAIYWE